jgi:hypothetical protein
VFVDTTFIFLNCCVGINTFRGHLCHCPNRKRSWFSLVLSFFLWPMVWCDLQRTMRSWTGQYFADVVLDVMSYWFWDSWRGVLFQYFNVQTGQTSETRVKSGDEVIRAIKENLDI